MAYCTQADLEERYGAALLVDLTDRGAEATGAIDADVVTRAISDADAVIDGYVAGRYTLPFATTPDPIATISRQIAIYKLHVYDPNSKIEKEYEGALQMLREISKGTVTLNAAGVTPPTTGLGSAQVTDRDRDFTAQTMKGFI